MSSDGYVQKTVTTNYNQTIMVSFQRFKSFRRNCSFPLFPGLVVSTQFKDRKKTTLWRECDYYSTGTFVWEANNITVRQGGYNYSCLYEVGCFKILISFHTRNSIPHRFSSGLYNCSVDYYWRFQQHLDCNMEAECQDSRDETEHCPFSSQACQGWIASGSKCFRFVKEDTLQKLAGKSSSVCLDSVDYCYRMNASLGAARHRGDWDNIFLPLLKRHASGSMVVVGLFMGGMSLPNEYRKSVVTYDKTVLHHTTEVESYPYRESRECILRGQDGLLAKASKLKKYTFTVAATCEFTPEYSGQYESDEATITFPIVSSVGDSFKIRLTRCSSGQLCHASPQSSENTSSIAWFTCDDEVTKVYFNLVCDFRQDCHDGSDESFCQHPPCDGFTCTSGQCVSYAKRCNTASDCIDESDENDCALHSEYQTKGDYLLSPVLVNFDSTHYFTKTKMSPNASCPNTHYRCPGEYDDCLPVFTRCNGWIDCIDQQDEKGCEELICPGFYRCFNSSMCVHTDHMCDGWPHCPRHDDEWFCYMNCPSHCLCQNNVFVCPRKFLAFRFPQLRYLDAEGSGMTLSDLYNNTYVVHVILRSCSLATLSVVKLNNLQILDLSRNKLETVNVEVFVKLGNLRTLSLAENPLSQLITPSTGAQQTALRTIDLSHTNLLTYNCTSLANFHNLENLNLSFTTLKALPFDSFLCAQRLTKLYLKGSRIKEFPANILKSLSHLRVVSTDNYRLCCKQTLPVQSDPIICDAPKDEISSCEDLLQSKFYRVCLWLISFLSVLGNVFCLMMRVCEQSNLRVNGFYVLVSNLSISDLLMGVYMAIIGVADELFRDKYLYYDETWTHSLACKVAGFLSLLSSEVSAFTIWLITLDRFIVLRFPFSTVRFKRSSAVVICLTTWIVGCLLATIPLLPLTSHWEFYSQTGICIPLPITRQDFKGRAYSVSLFIVLNFVLFLFIATGQAFIYWSVKKNALKTNATKVSRDLVMARRLISVAVTDFLCWFPIGLCGLLAFADTPISGEVNVALAIFVLPLNSALNPFMYTFNTAMEKRRKTEDAKLLKWLDTHSDILDRLEIP